MKTLMMVSCVVTGLVVAGCSQEDREEVSDRLSAAGKALTGDIRANGNGTPNIVKEQQKRERRRQDSTWTPENRAKHPIEYCQAQLEELTKHASQLDVQVHEVACAQSAVKRRIGDAEAQITTYEKFITDAKKTYKNCEAVNSWPAKIGGYSLSKEKTKEKIVEAAQKLQILKAQLATQRNQLVQLDKKANFLTGEQKSVTVLREKVEGTINDLRIKQVVDGEKGIADTLNAINDSMSALGVDYDDPKVEDVVAPDSTATRDELFNKIMAE